MAEGMNRYLLRVEGVNLDNFVYDTQDLATIRGGSLELLSASEVACAALTEDLGLTAVRLLSKGASTGLFELTCGADAARRALAQVRSTFRRHKCLQHATVTVDVVEQTDGFLVAREGAVAANRWRQMQSPSIAVPHSTPGASQACEVDKVRPATTKRNHAGEQQEVSDSVKQRSSAGGGKQKQDFYRQEAPKAEADMQFVWDLDELTNDAAQGNLHHKMAVIHVDGNHFGETQDGVIRAGSDPAKDQQEFDQQVRRLRRMLLEKLLTSMTRGADWRNGQRYRLETLLWGGDELTWVVPAWKGLEVIRLAFMDIARWSLISPLPAQALTCAAGLVFCHHKAPIHRVTKLAHELAEEAKRIGGRERNLVAYQILESFDHIGRDLTGYRQSLVPKGMSAEELLLPAEEISAGLAAMRALTAVVPRRRLARAVQLLRKTGRSDEDFKKAKLEIEAMERVAELEVATESALFARWPPGGLTRWVHLAELWDYLGATAEVQP